MFHSERMTQPGLPALPAFPQSPAVAAASMGGVPGMPQVPDAAAYTPLGQDVLREVQQFINQGGGAASALASPQASWLALQAARQAARKDGPERSSAVGGTQARRTRSPARLCARSSWRFWSALAPGLARRRSAWACRRVR
jgi:flagellar protein FlgJ